MKIIKDYLDKNLFNNLQSIVFSETFPFYYRGFTGHRLDKSDFYFEHILYQEKQQSSPHFDDLLMPIIGNLKYNFLIRAKLNCYTIKSKHIHTEMHRDYSFDHQVALFSFNTCNGYTYFEDTEEKIKSVANQLIIFDGKRNHCSVSQTDSNLRINININIL
tara:strand:- start:456 stop:938 length:483 start_codon:yes stop_codon:yes gene_type:complete